MEEVVLRPGLRPGRERVIENTVIADPELPGFPGALAVRAALLPDMA
jgi:hypothetical protein